MTLGSQLYFLIHEVSILDTLQKTIYVCVYVYMCVCVCIYVHVCDVQHFSFGFRGLAPPLPGACGRLHAHRNIQKWYS